MVGFVQLFVILWTVARQAPPSMGFSRKEYRSGMPFPSPGDRPNPGIEPSFPRWMDSDGFFTARSPGKSQNEWLIVGNKIKNKTKIKKYFPLASQDMNES